MTDTISIPGYKVGTWTVDPSLRGLVQRSPPAHQQGQGQVREVRRHVHHRREPLDSSVKASAEVASINTNDENRDGHLRTNDFFDAPTHPELTFVSTGIRYEGGDFLVDGDLTIKGVTKPVTFDLEFGGFQDDLYGNYKAGLTATTKINRNDFGVNWNAPLETGGVLVGDEVTITIDLQAALQK